ncbi:MAG: heterodisulfide reductase-related iron-sulfur binding cluster [Cyanobacteria bacterium P01_H01_bin.121]
MQSSGSHASLPQPPDEPVASQVTGGFDPQTPPDPALIDACVHCGFCLSTCPSYRVLGTEMDSPRGRIYLMDGVNEGQIELNAATAQHFDSCLGCFACVTTCPSGVQYDKLITATRPQLERNVPRNAAEQGLRQLLFALLPYPQRLRPLLRLAQLYRFTGLEKLVRRSLLPGQPSRTWFKQLAPQLAALESLLPPLSPEAFQDPSQEIFPAQGERRYRVGLLLGCVQRLFNPVVNEATIQVLTANGCEVVVPKGQGCCAAVTHHQGQVEQTETLARQLMDRFAAYPDLDVIVTNASGCGHTLKEYGEILKDDPLYAARSQTFASNVKDVQEFLAEVGLTATLHPLSEKPLVAVYQDACHMLHGQNIFSQPRKLLRQIPNLQLREPLDSALCCGSAGVYNILQPEVATELGRQKAQNLVNTGADLIASANIGCFVQISKHLALQGKNLPVLHPMQLLARSISDQT